MAAEPGRGGGDGLTEQGMAELEGYLLFAAHHEEAKRGAVRFTAQLPWLTSGQREDVERVYLRDRIEVYRDANSGVLERAASLRDEYSERYRRLRVRCVAATVASGAVGVGAAVLAASRFGGM